MNKFSKIMLITGLLCGVGCKWSMSLTSQLEPRAAQPTQAYLSGPVGQAWLKTQVGQNWLGSTQGQNLLSSSTGPNLLLSPPALTWLATQAGQNWLFQTQAGQNFLSSPLAAGMLGNAQVQQLFLTQAGQNWLLTCSKSQIPVAQALLSLPAGQAWLYTSAGQQWLGSATHYSLSFFLGSFWVDLCSSPPVQEWLLSPAGKYWLTFGPCGPFDLKGADYLIHTRGGVDLFENGSVQQWLLYTISGTDWYGGSAYAKSVLNLN